MNPVGTPTVHGRGQRARRLAAPRRVRFICQVFSPDLSSHTFRPPPVAATDIRVESTSSWQPPCSATANLAQATLHDVPMASVVASAPPLQNSIEAAERDSPRGPAYLATSTQQV